MNTSSFTAFQVPAYDTMPAEGMIEWLHALPINWDGDPGGINLEIEFGSDAWSIAGPGDWLVETPKGYAIMSSERFALVWQFQDMLADIPEFSVEEAMEMIKQGDNFRHDRWVIYQHDMDDSPIVASQDVDGLIFCASGDLHTSPLGASWVPQ